MNAHSSIKVLCKSCISKTSPNTRNSSGQPPSYDLQQKQKCYVNFPCANDDKGQSLREGHLLTWFGYNAK